MKSLSSPSLSLCVCVWKGGLILFRLMETNPVLVNFDNDENCWLVLVVYKMAPSRGNCNITTPTEREREREREMSKEGRGRETLHSLLVSIAPGWAMVGSSGGGGGRAAALVRKGTKRKDEEEEEESQQMMKKEENNEDHFWQQLFTTTSPPPLKAMMLLLNRIILDSPTEIRYTPFKAVPEIEEPEEVVVVSKSELVHLEVLAREVARSFKDY